MIQHTRAVRAKFEEIPALATKTHLGKVPKGADGKYPSPPYVVIHAADGNDIAERLAGPRATQRPRFTIHIVGSSVENVQTITAACKAKFIVNGLGVALSVPGERTSGLFWNSPIPIQWDDDINPSVPYQVIDLGFTSEPA